LDLSNGHAGWPAIFDKRVTMLINLCLVVQKSTW